MSKKTLQIMAEMRGVDTRYKGEWEMVIDPHTLDVAFRMGVGGYSLIIPNDMTVVQAFALLINNAGGSND